MSQRIVHWRSIPLAVLCAGAAYSFDDASDKAAARANSRDIQASILLQDEGRRGGEARISEVAANESFYSGDRFQLKIRSRKDGYIYVLLQDSRGEQQLLYPYFGDHRPGGNRIRRNAAQTAPGQAWLRFDEHPGQESLYILVSGKPVEELDRIAASPDGQLNRRLFRDLTGSDERKGIAIEEPGQDRETRDYDRSGSISLLRMNLVHLP
jgi:hypothetical protein